MSDRMEGYMIATSHLGGYSVFLPTGLWLAWTETIDEAKVYVENHVAEVADRPSVMLVHQDGGWVDSGNVC